MVALLGSVVANGARQSGEELFDGLPCFARGILQTNASQTGEPRASVSEEKKKPGVAFWATVVLIGLLVVAYPLETAKRIPDPLDFATAAERGSAMLPCP